MRRLHIVLLSLAIAFCAAGTNAWAQRGGGGHGGGGGGGVVSMAAGAEAFTAATAVEAFAAVTVEAASAVVTEVIEAVTVAGDMDTDGVPGRLGIWVWLRVRMGALGLLA